MKGLTRITFYDKAWVRFPYGIRGSIYALVFWGLHIKRFSNVKTPNSDESKNSHHARWTSGLSRLPFTEKSMGSNPIRVTNARNENYDSLESMSMTIWKDRYYCSYRLTVRTPGFQSGNESSILSGSTIERVLQHLQEKPIRYICRYFKLVWGVRLAGRGRGT